MPRRDERFSDEQVRERAEDTGLLRLVIAVFVVVDWLID